MVKTNQQELATFVGVSRQTISLYQNGNTQPNAEKLFRIAKFFNVSFDDLLGKPTKKDGKK